MARNDGIDRTSARNVDVPDKDIGNTQKHNEREKDSYRNPDIVPERTPLNIHFKAPTASYTEMFRQMEQDKIISTRGLKPDAIHFGELIFDVNSAYFHNHGGYEFARQFYADAYKAAVEIVGGEQYILSAVMHADEILVLDDGRIVGRGTHEELLRSCPEYLEIAKSQLSAKELGLDDAATETSALEANALEGGER